MKNILFPTDFSENSWNAIAYGLSLFKKSKCTFYITHISPVLAASAGETAMVLPPELIEEELLKESLKKLDVLLQRIEELPFNTKHIFHISASYGFFIEHIKNEVSSKKIDLIIMGTKGASGLKKIALGSNTGNVITKVKCAVLAVPEKTTYHKPKKIGFPTDYIIDYNLHILSLLKDITLLTNAALNFLHIESKDETLSNLQTKNKEFLAYYFKDITHNFSNLKGQHLDTAIDEFTTTESVDMLVMVAKNLNFLERILFRPTVEEISYHTNVPFLVLHE
ncbi:UspA domain-containing protein [Cellulophaga algicola DSM 14237]|uniref:UspA domain-containing protein n=1 Tax=Cellulophaga algicola (strain DSM 14237 / IC166 / ACAM 630) TaxID=688270 RepID=E6XF68_CELAD|nr:universal stress protein [Cellulophaga algicola]ADV50304.1 UspA domain-containing protein [Cellulophaga algicola DSM 14237]